MYPKLPRNVRSPLGFFTLVVLITETILGTVAGRASGPDFTLLIVSMVAIIVLLVVIVACIAYRQPEALIGMPPRSAARRCPECRLGPREENRPQ